MKQRHAGLKAAAMAMLLPPSALLTAVALRTPDQHWLAWFSFLPLFAVVRARRPSMAAVAGGTWGACLYLFCVVGTNRGIEPSLFALVLLTVVPALYVGLAALPARPTGFRLLLLALGWTLLETGLHAQRSLGLHQGLLSQSLGGSLHLHWLTQLMCCVVVAFAVACVNASLLAALRGAPLIIYRLSSVLDRSDDCGPASCCETFLLVERWAFHQAHPRAPPCTVQA